MTVLYYDYGILDRRDPGKEIVLSYPEYKIAMSGDEKGGHVSVEVDGETPLDLDLIDCALAQYIVKNGDLLRFVGGTSAQINEWIENNIST